MSAQSDNEYPDWSFISFSFVTQLIPFLFKIGSSQEFVGAKGF
jgi:hypothetical protein